MPDWPTGEGLDEQHSGPPGWGLGIEPSRPRCPKKWKWHNMQEKLHPPGPFYLLWENLKDCKNARKCYKKGKNSPGGFVAVLKKHGGRNTHALTGKTMSSNHLESCSPLQDHPCLFHLQGKKKWLNIVQCHDSNDEQEVEVASTIGPNGILEVLPRLILAKEPCSVLKFECN